jgi:alpha-tubulin suppressor-like RCC1 family protein
VREDGTLWAWGANSFGQLGQGTYTSTNIPQPVAGNVNWQAVRAGGLNTVALGIDGTLWAWGANDDGQLGDGTYAPANTPQMIGTNAAWQAVATSGKHTVAVCDDGTLWGWGDNTLRSNRPTCVVAQNS